MKSKIIITIAISLASFSALADHISLDILDIAERTLKDKDSTERSIKDANIILNNNIKKHQTSSIKTPKPKVKKILIKSMGENQENSQEVKIEAPIKAPEPMVENYKGVYRDFSALRIIEDLIPEDWELELDDVERKLVLTRVNYYTEKSRMESISEIVYGLGFKMKVFSQLKIIIITK